MEIDFRWVGVGVFATLWMFVALAFAIRARRRKRATVDQITELARALGLAPVPTRHPSWTEFSATVHGRPIVLRYVRDTATRLRQSIEVETPLPWLGVELSSRRFTHGANVAAPTVPQLAASHWVTSGNDQVLHALGPEALGGLAQLEGAPLDQWGFFLMQDRCVLRTSNPRPTFDETRLATDRVVWAASLLERLAR